MAIYEVGETEVGEREVGDREVGEREVGERRSRCEVSVRETKWANCELIERITGRKGKWAKVEVDDAWHVR